MKIAAVIDVLESLAPPVLQESYDNAGLLTGDPSMECTGVLCTLDALEEVIQEAIDQKVNLVVAHHPIIFAGLKKINGKNYVERTIIKAIKHDIAIYAIHTNLDNVIHGVNGKMAELLGLSNRKTLSPKSGTLKKLYSFVPTAHLEEVRDAIFKAGGGVIGNYSECSFNVEGRGTFKPNEKARPFVGHKGNRHEEGETKFEVIFPYYLEHNILKALREAHPYEEVAFDVITLSNNWESLGSGLVGNLPNEMPEEDFLELLSGKFHLNQIRHTRFTGRQVSRIALCGGAGSFLLKDAIRAGADVYVTADMKYHEFFDADNRLMVCDIGHYESEQFTIDLLYEVLVEKFTTFAVLKSKVFTNPVQYFTVKNKLQTDHGQR